MIKNIIGKNQLLESLQDITSDLLITLDQFSPQAINRIPFENSWTAAQVADHLTKSNNSIAKALLLKGTAINRNPGERVEELKGIFLNFKAKFKSPEFIVPTQDIYERKTVIANLERSIEKIKEVSLENDLSEMINHPAFGDITKFEILHFVIYHTQRHIHQLEKILEVVTDR